MGVSCLQSFRGSSDQLPIPNWSAPDTQRYPIYQQLQDFLIHSLIILSILSSVFQYKLAATSVWTGTVGKLGCQQQHIIGRSILTNTNHSWTMCQANTAESLKQPNFRADFLATHASENIVVSVLQPFFSWRWVWMAPSCPPNLSLSPPFARPQLPWPCLPKNCPIFARAFRATSSLRWRKQNL